MFKTRPKGKNKRTSNKLRFLILIFVVFILSYPRTSFYVVSLLARAKIDLTLYKFPGSRIIYYEISDEYVSLMIQTPNKITISFAGIPAQRYLFPTHDISLFGVNGYSLFSSDGNCSYAVNSIEEAVEKQQAILNYAKECSPQAITDKKDISSNWKEYTAKTLPLSFTYPSTWNVLERENRGLIIAPDDRIRTEIKNGSDKDFGAMDTLNIFVDPPPSFDMLPTKTWSKYYTEETHIVEIAGKSAGKRVLFWLISPPGYGQPMPGDTMSIIVANNQGHTYHIRAINVGYSQTLTKILESIQFTD